MYVTACAADPPPPRRCSSAYMRCASASRNMGKSVSGNCVFDPVAPVDVTLRYLGAA
jgi:hypothetical protein